ncbi:MAG: ABC transporter permease subunit [Bacillota bacterium]|nr:ABC transporter permease subunit [Bacillota bacterium]
MVGVKRSSLLGSLLLVAVAAYLLLPILASLLFALATRWDHTLWPEGFTLEAFHGVLSHPDFWAALSRSLLLAVGSVLLSALLILPAALAADLAVPRLRPILEVFSLLPYAIPGVLLALGLIQVYAPLPLPFYGTPLLLLFAVSAVAMPFMYRAVEGALQTTRMKDLVEAGLTLGASWPFLLRQVVIPVLAPGLLSGSLLVMSLAFGEFALTNLLVGSSWKTLPVWIYQVSNTNGQVGSVLAVISFSLTFLLVGLLLRQGHGGGMTLVPGNETLGEVLSRGAGRQGS